MKTAASTLMLLAVLSYFVSAAPAPWGIAINAATHECAGYWGGDEFVGYGLSEGWKAHYPTYIGGNYTIKTDAGSCTFVFDHEDDCCKQIGYKYVAKNIGAGDKTQLRERPDGYPQNRMPGWVWMLLAVAAALAGVAALIVAAAVMIYLMRRRGKAA